MLAKNQLFIPESFEDQIERDFFGGDLPPTKFNIQ